MASIGESKPRCVLLAPLGAELQIPRHRVMAAAEQSGVRFVWVVPGRPVGVTGPAFAEISRADLVLAFVSDASPSVLYEIGLAHASGKPVVLLVDEQAENLRLGKWLLASPILRVVGYTQTAAGQVQFESAIAALLGEFKREPGRFAASPEPPEGSGR